jgi:hypothetical protein
MMWIPMTYIAVGLARLFPLNTNRWPLYAPLHIVGAVACSSIGGVLWISSIWLLTGGAIDFVERLQSAFVAAVPIDSIIYFAVLAGVYGFDYYRLHKEDQRRTERLRAELAEAELTTLRTQLNPHFLFNILSTLASKARTDPEEARQLLLRLAEALKLFDIPFALTGGGPGIAIQSYSLLAFPVGLRYFALGYASATAHVLLLVVTIIVTFFFRRLRETYA